MIKNFKPGIILFTLVYFAVAGAAQASPFTPPEPTTYYADQKFPNLAAAEGQIVIGWEKRDSTSGLQFADEDLLYSYGAFDSSTAARDWACYE